MCLSPAWWPGVVGVTWEMQDREDTNQDVPADGDRHCLLAMGGWAGPANLLMCGSLFWWLGSMLSGQHWLAVVSCALVFLRQLTFQRKEGRALPREVGS